MTYVTSDLHGYPLEDIIKKLGEIGFDPSDRLYVLGDCVDRGKDGVKILRFIMSNPNITLIMGNHEAMMLENEFLFDGDDIPSVFDLKGEKRALYSRWATNGGVVTLDSLLQFTDAQIRYIFRFVQKAPLYKEIEVGTKEYILTHSGLGNFDADKPLCEYTESELLWTRPELDTTYYTDGRTVIFGHSPTARYGTQYEGRPVYTDTWINIDVGASIGKHPLILRLDDMKEFYV